jgi:hypothetical protein
MHGITIKSKENYAEILPIQVKLPQALIPILYKETITSLLANTLPNNSFE